MSRRGDTQLIVGDAVDEAAGAGWAGGAESRAWLISLLPQRALVWVLVSEKLVLGDRDTFFPQRSTSHSRQESDRDISSRLFVA